MAGFRRTLPRIGPGDSPGEFAYLVDVDDRLPVVVVKVVEVTHTDLTEVTGVVLVEVGTVVVL